MTYLVDGQSLTIEALYAIAVGGEKVAVSDECRAAVRRHHGQIQEWGASRRPIYGVNTGFGELAHVLVPPEWKTELQVNLLRNHATAVGSAFDEPVTRAVLTARLNCLARGHSGASEAIVDLLAEFLNCGVHPVIPEQGSLGASGDISPLCHMALPLIGEGRVIYDGVEHEAAAVLRHLGISPVELGFKEGLALINGTSASAGAAAVAMYRAQRLLSLAVLLSGLYIQALGGSTRAYAANGHLLKGHPGQITVASRIEGLLSGSGLTIDHEELMARLSAHMDAADHVADAGIYIQSAYSLRCVPQILGPILDTMTFCREIIERELNSSNDNPLLFDTAEETFHGGNFHGQYVGFACDYLGIALTQIGVLAERQINRLVDPHLNGHLPEFLALRASGLSSGLSGTQYLATSIAAENLDLAAPASVKSLASNAGNQDVVSMSLNAARKALRLSENVGTMLAVLAGCVFQALNVAGAHRISPAGRRWHEALADVVRPYDDAMPVYEYVQAVRDFAVTGPGAELAEQLAALNSDPVSVVVASGLRRR